jgi:hypothetical protein
VRVVHHRGGYAAHENSLDAVQSPASLRQGLYLPVGSVHPEATRSMLVSNQCRPHPILHASSITRAERASQSNFP